ncbi:ABC transporter ATP-binding protein [Haloferax sp. DFSO52]|uniref:ABC transporter ATP-binding protein n=1 Tax=Haloferax sp. DFSO52 TaxID=3388505 RepID=UPI003A8BAAFA
MPALEIESLQKSYGDVTALSGLSLTVAEGELFGLLGPNGAGKTTTMEILTGQIVPDSGRVSVLGIDPVAHPTAVRERVGILPEKESPPSFMTPREYFDFIGAIRNLSSERVDDQTQEWAERLNFVEKLDTLSTDLSRGQQQKVMIAGTFLHNPDIVVIDEPLANLDPIMQERIKRFLVEYRAAGNTILISTHNVDVAAELCSRVGIVYDGSLVADVVPSELGPDERLLDFFLDRLDTDVEPGAASL